MKHLYLFASVGTFASLLVAAWVTHGTGVVRDDPERNIWIPKDLTSTLQVKAAYNGDRIWFRYRWPEAQPDLVQGLLVYQDGKWEERDPAEVGADPARLTQDRLGMMVDDGMVPQFSRYGGYLAIGQGLTTFTGTPETEEERTKYLPQTRSDPGNFDTTRPAAELESERKAGYFLDLWDWKAAETSPDGRADDTFIAESREPDPGDAGVTSNLDPATGLPRFMFDPAKVPAAALSIDAVSAGGVLPDAPYALTEATAVPFDATRAWKNGDALPMSVLGPASGSVSDITTEAAVWADGFWDVTLSRKLDTGDPVNDKIFVDGGSYDLAFAVFRNASTMRWHYISLPATLGLGRPAEIEAQQFDGSAPAWDQPWFETEIFYPGQVNWPRLTDPSRHPGADKIAAGVPVKARHKPEQLALYGIETEFAAEIKQQWLKTLIASIGLILALGIALNLLITRKER